MLQTGVLLATIPVFGALMKGSWKGIVLGIAVSLIFVLWAGSKIEQAELFESLANVSLLPLLLTLGVVYLSLPLRAVQWLWLLGESSRGKIWPSFKAICVGHLGNFLLPARGGELVRAYYLAKLLRRPVAGLLPSIVLSRVQDLLPIFGLLLVSFVFAAPLNFADTGTASTVVDDSSVNQIALGTLSGRLLLVVLACSILLALVFVLRGRLLQLSKRFSAFLPTRIAVRIRTLTEEVVDGISVVGNLKQFWGAQALSFVCWGLFAVAPIPLLLSFGFSLYESVVIGIVQTAVTSLTFVLPSTPGSVGTFHVLCVASIHACVPGVDASVAVSYTVVIHLVGMLGPGLPGLLILPFDLGNWRVAKSRMDLMDPSTAGMPERGSTD